MSVLKASYEEALKLIGENMDLMDKLAGHLIEKETITGKEFMEIFRREKGLPDPAEEKAAEEKNAEERASEGETAETETGESEVPEPEAAESEVPAAENEENV
jgi:cell division protease FtsH